MEEEEEQIPKGDDVIVELDASLEDLYMGGSLKVILMRDLINIPTSIPYISVRSSNKYVVRVLRTCHSLLTTHVDHSHLGWRLSIIYEVDFLFKI